jgi:DNA polymerase III sliding clamp (beta) subunit (PCNA family)
MDLMKLTINRDLLLKAVRRCDLKASQTGNAALACVALHAKRIPDMPGGLDLKATNGLVGVATMVACTTIEEAAVAIHCKHLVTAIAQMPNGDLSLETQTRGDSTRLTIRGGNRTWSEQARPVADVRDLPDPPDSGERLKLPAPDLLALLDRTRFTIADVSAERTGALGVFLDASDAVDAIVLGNHVWTRSTLARKNPGDPFRALLTEMALPHVRDLAIDAGNETVEFSRNDHFTWIENSSTMVCFSPPPGDYHDWRDLFSRVRSSPICRLPRLATLETLKAMIATSTTPDLTRTWVRLLQSGELRLDYQDPKDETFFHDTVQVSDIEAGARPLFMANAYHLLQAVDAAGGDVVLRHDVNSGTQIVLATEDGFWCMNSLFAPDGHPPPLDGTDPPRPVPPTATPPGEKTGADKPKRSGRKPSS